MATTIGLAAQGSVVRSVHLPMGGDSFSKWRAACAGAGRQSAREWTMAHKFIRQIRSLSSLV